MPKPQAVWNDLQSHIREQISTDDFNTWFLNVVLSSTDDDSIILDAPNKMIRDWLESQYATVILDAAEKVLGHPTNLQIVVGEPSTETQRPTSSEAGTITPAVSAAQPPVYENLIPHYVFANFVEGPSNRLSFAASQAVADAPGLAYNPLFLHGSVGLGKTHLLQAICHQVLQDNPKANVVFLNCEQFVNHYISAIRSKDFDAFRKMYRNVDLLVIDDIQFLSEKERCQEEFFHTFNTLFNAQKQIILASDCPPQDLPLIEERLVSRFKMGLVTHLESPQYETRCAILQQKALLRGVTLPESVIDYIATNIRSNVRELEGAILKVISYGHLMGQAFDLNMAVSALSDSINNLQRTVNANEIERAVIEHYSLKPNDLQSKRRTKSIAFPRQVGMYLIRTMTSLSLEDIGSVFGGRDHTTVLYGVEKIRKQLEVDQDLKKNVDSLIQRLTKA